MHIRQEQTSAFADPDSPMRQYQLEHIEETVQELTGGAVVSQFAGSLLLDESMNFCGEPVPKQREGRNENDAK